MPDIPNIYIRAVLKEQHAAYIWSRLENFRSTKINGCPITKVKGLGLQFHLFPRCSGKV